ncbi:hypothetical protein BD410DRAFT_898594 [Rickenella mellea]|uniref:Uncharacterized protein n=1 Tax=Rickenella mellea TaxID=50990 RepID=A0A4Y7Q412_9AGAM|nr:hypothetical protein BD410DRAFT_898594 [Rickenella mellea]
MSSTGDERPRKKRRTTPPAPDTPQAPETLQAAEIPHAPEIPQAPQAPETPQASSQTSQTQQTEAPPPVGTINLSASANIIGKNDEVEPHYKLWNIFNDVYANPAWAAKLDPSYKDLETCKTALSKDGQRDGSLLQCILDCSTTGLWDPLFAHPDLQAPKRRHSRGFPASRERPVIDAFETKYIGSAYKVMLQAIDDLKAHKQYACILPVVQSSGMGKSKTVHRISEDRIHLPMCLREDDVPGTFSYPRPDARVRDKLTTAPSSADEEACKAFIRGFLGSIFSVTKARLEQFSKGSSMEYSSLVKSFFDLFNDEEERERFYDDVISPHWDFNVNELSSAWSSLDKALTKMCDKLPDGYPIIFSMDEVHVIYEPRSPLDVGTEFTLYSRFKSVLSELASKTFGTVVLTTATAMSKLAPSKAIAPSYRERIHDLELPAPFTELPFDTALFRAPLAQGVYNIKTVGTLEFTARFGRPLWDAMYTQYMKDVPPPQLSDAIERVMTVVMEKLSSHELPLPPCTLNPLSIAILSSRLLLDLSPATTKAREYERELVRSHLRIVYSVHEDQEVSITGSSPEPLVAEAAARIMNKVVKEGEKDMPYMNTWSLLVEYVTHGMAPQGTVGELIGRALTIQAMDHAIHKLKSHCELKYQTPVPVNEFYKALLTKEAWEVLRHSVPANQDMLTKGDADKTFETAFTNAYFRVSHWAKANDATPLNKHYAWALWLRGTAILCQLNQELSDRGMPIYFEDCGPVSAESISLNLHQDKTSATINPAHVSVQSAEALNLFSGETNLPYIATVHCYALLKDQHLSANQLNNRSRSKKTKNKEAPRYQIDICGLEPYRLLSKAEKSHIRSMINGSKTYLFDKHPRQNGLPTLRRLQPVLTGDADTTQWFGGFAQWCAMRIPIKQ